MTSGRGGCARSKTRRVLGLNAWSRRSPDPMARRWVSVAGRHRVQTPLDPEREELLLVEPFRRFPEFAFLEELRLQLSS